MRSVGVEKRKNLAGFKGTILCIGDDPYLLHSRCMVLEYVGYRVCCTSSLAVLKENEPWPVDLVLICHTVEDVQATRITARLRQMNPVVPIVRMTKMDGRQQGPFDGFLLPLAGPEQLLDEINHILFGKKPNPHGSSSAEVQRQAC